MSQLASVLVVDDDNIHQAVTKAMLKKKGFPVLAAYDGPQAISTFKEHESAIGWILLDIHMPNMDGVEVFQHLRDVSKDVQVIIVSGYINQAKTRSTRFTPSPSIFKKAPGLPTAV